MDAVGGKTVPENVVDRELHDRGFESKRGFFLESCSHGGAKARRSEGEF